MIPWDLSIPETARFTNNAFQSACDFGKPCHLAVFEMQMQSSTCERLELYVCLYGHSPILCAPMDVFFTVSLCALGTVELGQLSSQGCSSTWVLALEVLGISPKIGPLFYLFRNGVQVKSPISAGLSKHVFGECSVDQELAAASGCKETLCLLLAG